MKLKELKKMIAEEYSAYKRSKRIKEQGMPELPPIDDMPVDPMAGMGDAPKLDVGPDDIDVSGEKESPEETLRAIYDMLKDFFEGDKDKGDDKAPEMPDMPEIPTMDGAPDMGMLQERFKKLANIIK